MNSPKFDYSGSGLGPWVCTSPRRCVTTSPYRCSECGADLAGERLTVVDVDAGESEAESVALARATASSAQAAVADGGSEGGRVVDEYGGDE